MFEIPDDDDGFWEKLPLDEVGLEIERERQSNPSTFSSSGIALKNGVPNITSYHPLSLAAPPLTNSSNNNNNNNNHSNSNVLQTNRSQLAQIHNVLNSNSNRTRDQACSASSHSAVIAANSDDIPSKKYQVEEDLVQYKPGSKRKFPGPAGILPESISKLHHDSPILMKDSTRDKEVLHSSQPSPACDPFSSAPWLSLVADIGPDAKSVLNKFSIRSMLIKACKRLLPKGKIPLVFASVDSVEFHGCDGTAVLKDPSGKVHGALHNDLVKDPGTALKAGCVIVLRQTSVISPTPRTHYLNITPANIVVIYSQTKGSHDVLKSPWSPMASPKAPISPSLPPLHQIIQDSDDELKMAVNYPQTPQHAISRLDAPRTPNVSPISLFGSVSNNSPSLQPASSFPSPGSNTPDYRQFKSPHIANTARRPMDPPSYGQVINPCHSNNSNSFFPQNRFSSNHSVRNTSDNPHQNQPSMNAHNNVSLPAKYTHHQKQRDPSSKLPSLSSGPNPRVSNQQAVQTKSMVHDDFLDDDSDLLSLCEDAEMISSDIMTHSNHTNSKSTTAITPICKNHAAVNSSKPGTHDLNFAFDPSTSESLLRKCGGINSAFQKPFSENGRNPSFVQQGRIGFSSKPTATKQLDNNNSLEIDNCSSGEKGDRGTGRDGDDVGGGRDARIQLGVSNPPSQQQKQQQCDTAEQALDFGTWDDDLDDELLSQL